MEWVPFGLLMLAGLGALWLLVTWPRDIPAVWPQDVTRQEVDELALFEVDTALSVLQGPPKAYQTPDPKRLAVIYHLLRARELLRNDLGRDGTPTT